MFKFGRNFKARTRERYFFLMEYFKGGIRTLWKTSGMLKIFLIRNKKGK